MTGKTLTIDVIQYMRPTGRPKSIRIEEMPDDLTPTLELMKKCGVSIAAEQLSIGNVSFTLEHDLGDFDIELCNNGPGENGTRASLERLIRRFDEDRFHSWYSEFQG